jgi:copper chaperone CopZ
MSKFLIASTILLASAALVRADDPKPDSKKLTSATYLITGLHCPPCTKVVESSIAKVPGVKSIKVDWDTKNAKVEFDESVVPAERVAQLIAGTPHMMGPSMHYGSWLALKAPELNDDATAKTAKEALGKVKGVKAAEAFPKQHIVEVQFDADGKATSAQLIEALASAGVKAETY